MSGRPASEAYGWGHQQPTAPPPHGGPTSSDASMMQQSSMANRHVQTLQSNHFRDHPLPSPNSSSYATSYMQARPAPSSNGGMTYGMGAPMSDSNGVASGPYASQPTMGQYGGFQYGSQGFYGAPQPAQQHPDALLQQHQQPQQQQQQSVYYGSHHPGNADMDPNAQGQSMYSSAAPLDAGAMGQFHGESGMMGAGGPYAGLHGVGIRPKRKQVKNACVNCQKACKKCDEGRPCGRCVKYGLTDTCQDSARKERRRGVKRGPYKRRATTGSQPSQNNGMGMPIGGAQYGRDGHMTSSAPEESQLSSPGFGGQMVPPRPPLPIGMQSNVSTSWHSTSSPSLRSVDDDRDARFSRGMGGGQMGPNSYYGYDGQDVGGPSPYDRSSSAPIPGPGSLVLSPIGSLGRLQPPPGTTPGGSGHQLPSLLSSSSTSGNFGSLYNNGGSRPLVSPSLHSGPSGGFLNAPPGPTPLGHSRLHSDGSFGSSSLNSAGTSSSTMSPRTPINGPSGDYTMMSPPVSGKSSSYVPPQPTVPTGASTFLSQDASRPFPLKMPKVMPRNRSGTASSFLEAQAMRSRGDYDHGHGDGSSGGGAPSLAPIRREGSDIGQRSPYLGTSSHHVHSGGNGAGDDLSSRRLGPGSGLTPRIELSSYPTPMSMSSGAGALAKREADVPGSLGLA